MTATPGSVDVTRARFDVGDPLRALAALGVVAVHAIALSVASSGYGEQVNVDPRAYFATLYGLPGHAFNGLLSSVSLFFVLSGYLLSRPFLRAYLADAPFPSVPGYLRNRALRIFPAFLFVLLVALVVEGTRGDSWADIAGLATLVGNFQTAGLRIVLGQCWSLAVEMRFYLLLPLAALLLLPTRRVLARRHRVVLVLVLLSGLLVFSQRYAFLHPGSASFLANVQFFVPGIMLAALEHTGVTRLGGRRWIAPLAVVTFAAGAVLLLTSRVLQFDLPQPAAGSVVVLAVGLIVAGPLVWQWSGRRAWRVLDNAVLRWVGERSYPLFLVHGLVYFNLAPHLVTGGYKATLLVLGPVGLAVSLVCSDIVHRFVELPALRRKRAYAGSSAAPAPVASLPVKVG